MKMYRRMKVPGAAVFFTVCLADRGSRLLVDEIDLLRWSVGKTRQAHPFDVLGWVVLPDRMHAIWQLPEGDSGYGRRWGAIKGRFSRALGEAGRSPTLRLGARSARGEVGIWQKRFWEHHIRNAADLQAHLDLCRQAPIDAGLVARSEDWPYLRLPLLQAA